LLLYVVTDRSWLGENKLENQVEEIIKAGASFIQLREKELSFDKFVREGQKMKEITDKYNVPLIINDNVDVSLAINAEGVHVGQSDGNACDVRARIGKDKILGISVQTVEQALLAEEQGADYLGVGAVFATATKDDADSVSLETLKAICAAVRIPVVAIGGINRRNILQLKGTGIDGAAVISAVFAEPDVGAATRELLSLAKETVRKKAKGLILDLDGTLLDSMGVWDNIGAEYLRSEGVEPIPATLWETLKPMSLLQAAEYFISEFGLLRTPRQVMDGINSMIEDKYKYEVELKEGVREFLEKNRGLKMCIATETDRYLAECALKKLGIERYFDFVITSAETGGSKQSPEIYRKAAERLGLAVEEIIVFEDALHAVKAARSAGFYTVGVRERVFEDDREKIRETADFCVENLNEFEVT
jgi:thiamine-phosphate pyrophosphorylase